MKLRLLTITLVVTLLFSSIGNGTLLITKCSTSKTAVSQGIVSSNSDKPSYIDYLSNKWSDEQNRKSEFVPGEILVKFKENIRLHISKSPYGAITTALPSINNLNKKYGVSSVKKIFEKNSRVCCKLTFPNNECVLDVVEEYNKNPNVDYAEPNYIFHTCNIPNDPYFKDGSQWALNQLNDYDIDAPEAWDITHGDDGIVIAIVDTGVDYNHPDLKNNTLKNAGKVVGFDFLNSIDANGDGDYDDSGDIKDDDPMDDFGHGTHCAGIAAAVGNNGVGITGICWNCKIMPVKVGNADKLPLDAIVNGIIYAVENGADVISMSFGGYPLFGQPPPVILKETCDYAWSEGVILVAAAGNENTDCSNHYPSSYDNVISVGASDKTDRKAFFSNFGPSVDVAAPGVDILSLRAEGTDIYGDGGSHIVDDEYYIASGTSMACPFVAGLAALILSKDRTLENDVVKDIICHAVDRMDPTVNVGVGRINIYEALQQGSGLATALISSPLHGTEIKGVIDICGTVWGEGFRCFTVEYGKGKVPESWSELGAFNDPVQNGVLASSWNTMELADGLYTVKLRVECNNGIYADKIWIVINNIGGSIVVVDDDNTEGPWDGTQEHPYQYIMDGVDAAGKNETIYVHIGSYDDRLEIRKSSVNLIGEERSSTIVKEDVYVLNTASVTVNGFTIDGENDKRRDFGVYVKDSYNINISKNKIKGYSNGWGIWISDSFNNEIYHNIIMDNCQGIVFLSVRNSYITKNELISNNISIYLIDSNNNFIYYNNFKGKEENNMYAGDSGGINQWDDGEKEGNYWEDYEEKYPDAIQIDGVWDTPYRISKNNYDNSPWVKENGKSKSKSVNLNATDVLKNLLSRLFPNRFPLFRTLYYGL